VAWCGIAGDDKSASAEFVLSVRQSGASKGICKRLRIDPEKTARRRWRKLVLEVSNDCTQQIELTLKAVDVVRSDTGARAVWGEPKVEWRRPFAEIKPLLHDAARQVLNGRLLSAARTLHGRLSSSSYPTLYQYWLSRHAASVEALRKLRERAAKLGYRPLVSVVTPVYNTDARWLRACVESVKRQAYPNWELCLADDGSTLEETRAVLQEYEGDPRIKVRTLPHNAGIAAASNAALSLAAGEFVAFLDHDDEIAPDALFEVVACLNDHPETDYIYSDEDKIETDGTRGGVYFKPGWSPEHFLTNMYTCHLMVVRRSLIESIGGFRPGFEGLRSGPSPDRTDGVHPPPAQGAVSLAQDPGIDGRPRGCETARERRRAESAAGLREPQQPRRGSRAWRVPVSVPRPFCDSRRPAGIDCVATHAG
jgi:hypothetical protein